MPTTKVRPAQGAEEEGSQCGYGKNKAWACSLPREPQRDAICGNHTDPGHRAPILHSSDWQRVQAHPISSYGAAGQQWVGVWPDYGCHSSFCCKAGGAAATRTVLRDPSCPRSEPSCSTGNVSGCPERTDSCTYTSSQVLSQVAHPAVRLQVPQAVTARGRKALANPTKPGSFFRMKTPLCSAVFSVHLPLTSQRDAQQRANSGCLSAAGVGTAAFRTQQLMQTGFQAFCTFFLQPAPVPTRNRAEQTQHTKDISKGDITFTQQPVQPARPTPSGRQAAPSERTTPGDPPPASLQSEGPGGSTEISLEQCCTYSLRCLLVAYICLAACPPPGRGDRTWKRLLSSCKAKLVFSGQLALPLEYRELPGAAGQAPRKG